MSKTDYSYTVELKHNEAPAKINIETGEVKPVGRRRGKPNPHMQKFDLMENYTRFNTAAWKYVEQLTTKEEYNCAVRLAHMARAYTNSLIPLSDDTTLIQLSEYFGVNRNVVAKYAEKLFRLGVYGKFDVVNDNQIHTKYWVFNPYLAFNGDKIRKDVVTLFDNTTIAILSKGSKQ